MAARVALRSLIVAALLLPAPGVLLAKGKDRLPRPRRSSEFKYVDETDDERAAALLPKLLSKYDTPKKCASLLRILRTKRSYPGRMPARHTLAHRCSDGKSRQFTWILPKKVSRRKPVGVLFFLHGAIRQPAPGGGANEAGMFAPAVRDLNLIVVGPSTYGGVEWGAPACRELFHHALDFLKQHFNVDENRVYIAGDSDGGRGTHAMVETEATFLASAVPVIGAPGGVTRYAVLVSDEMLDLSKPIEVHTNDKLSFRGLVAPDARVILEEARKFKDRKLVFVNRIAVEVGE